MPADRRRSPAHRREKSDGQEWSVRATPPVADRMKSYGAKPDEFAAIIIIKRIVEVFVGEQRGVQGVAGDRSDTNVLAAGRQCAANAQEVIDGRFDRAVTVCAG